MTKAPLEGLDAGFGERIREAWKIVNKDGKGEKKIGASKTQIYRYINHEQSPSFVNIVAMSRESGFALEWLASGTGPKFHREDDSGQTIDKGFFLEVAELVESILKKKGLKPEFETRLKLVLAIYNTEIEKASGNPP